MSMELIFAIFIVGLLIFNGEGRDDIIARRKRRAARQETSS